jgi:hypothetical protein
MRFHEFGEIRNPPDPAQGSLELIPSGCFSHHKDTETRSPKNRKPSVKARLLSSPLRALCDSVVSRGVEAENQQTAEKEAMETVEDQPFDLRKPTLTQEIVKTGE